MFNQYNEVVHATNGRVVEMRIKLTIEDTEGVISITDIMFQGGAISTKWGGHPSEIKWTVDG